MSPTPMGQGWTGPEVLWPLRVPKCDPRHGPHVGKQLTQQQQGCKEHEPRHLSLRDTMRAERRQARQGLGEATL